LIFSASSRKGNNSRVQGSTICRHAAPKSQDG
jgi:hypothetical protein